MGPLSGPGGLLPLLPLLLLLPLLPLLPLLLWADQGNISPTIFKASVADLQHI
jgi:hypothetical protein